MDGSAIETTVPEVADLVAHLKKAKKPDLAAYAGLLFRRASAEDLTRLSLDDLARYAEKSLAFIETRKGKKPKVRVENPDFHEMSDRPPVTVIDIVNPNMPFLLDSVMDLLQAAGHVVDLVVHPILTIERTRGGKRSAFHRPEPDDGDRGVRESIMHIHVRRIEVPDDRKALARELEKVLEDVRVVVADWKPMRKRLSEALAS
ncbi:MAG: NAD-glutamate dehydrogenase, partial [Pseudomonadota bacterium]